MKKISGFIAGAIILGSFSALAGTNLSDSVDKNITPASQETRQKVEEPKNLPDSKDRNKTPAYLEKRQQQEEPWYKEDSQKSDEQNQ